MAQDARWHTDDSPRGRGGGRGRRGRGQGRGGSEAGVGERGPRRWNPHSGNEELAFSAHNSRKRQWEAEEEQEHDADAEQSSHAVAPVRKRKRGGKGAREKELKWKLAHGLVADASEVLAAPDASADETAADVMSVKPENAGLPAGSELRVEKPKSAAAAKVKPSKLAGLPNWIAYPLTVPDSITSTPESSVSNPQWGLSPRVIARLAAKNITHLFPVQIAVLPRLLQTRYSSASVPPGDLCVSAPTGSGKTLAYALPIVEALGNRVVPRVRALIVLPTRDLAAQVKVTFDMLLRGTDVKAVLITGQTTFTTEQSQLVAPEGGGSEWDVLTEADGSSLADIVIATPGRLIDHLKGTKGFTLRHLRFLVIDEADRLLNQSYQDWLQHVLNAADPSRDAASVPVTATGTQLESGWAQLGLDVDALGLPVHKVTSYRHAASATATTSVAEPCVRHCTPLQKLLFSATLTRNPAKIASLHLYNPTYVAVVGADGTPSAENASAAVTSGEDSRYIAPSTLEERMIVCASAGDKPLSLLHILYNLEPTGGGVLVFTKSVEAAHRLAALIQIFDRSRKDSAQRDSASSDSSSDSESDGSDDDDDSDGSRGRGATAKLDTSSPAQAFSSDLTPVQRRGLLASFQSGRIRALVCSDVMARGMDLGESVAHVVNYDLPSRTKTYVHRVGRTARAGRAGVAWTILEAREARWFKQEVVRKVERGDKTVKRVKVTADSVSGLVEGYQDALKELAGLVHKADGAATGGAKTKPVKAQKSQEDVKSSSDESSSDSSADSSESNSDEDNKSDSSASASSSFSDAGVSDSDDDEDAGPVQALLPSSNPQTAARNANTRRLEAALLQAASLVAPPQTRLPLAGGREWWDEGE
ncbi:ATP-dependent RNA helicase dbp6 [Geranomyces michiganensis]|nr:ATP-dependent RNA helicase dbp6 [Geranomyces michiganensis]